MKHALPCSWLMLFLFLLPTITFGQAPNLGSTAPFAIFTAVGEITNTGNTVVMGDLGTGVGAFTGFPPGVVNGQIHIADATAAQAAVDVDVAFMELSTATCGLVLAVGMGNGQTLTPNVYCIGAAATLTGNLILDGQFDPESVFIIQIDGAFASTISSQVLLINGASLCNVYWQINGAVSLGDNSIFRGTIVANGAITLQEGATLFGRALSREGAIHLHNNAVDADVRPLPVVITAGGNTSFCLGGSVVLSGNTGGIWNTGETTPSIIVTTSGEYFVTTTNDCGSAVSNIITVTVNQPPICTITGEDFFCEGGSTQLCTPPGAAAYLWSTGEITNCIDVNLAGNYSVTVTDLSGCTSVCDMLVTESPAPICTITGDDFFCEGGSTQLCTPPGAAAYLWSTGEITNCIDVNLAGNYSVTVTDLSGCTSVCDILVTESPTPICTITGDDFFCEGGSTQLCTTTGAAAYLWSTGEITNCITVSIAGTYSVTLTDLNGCNSICDILITESPAPICTITGNDFFCEGESTQLCAPPGAAAYLWSTGEITNCITVSIAGTYSVTLTDINGCTSICNMLVTESPAPICTITGDDFFCEGGSTQICTPPGAAAHLWSTGEITNCIDVNLAGNYSVTVTDLSGCTSVCDMLVTESPAPICTITGEDFFCEGGSTQICTPPGAAAYLWSTGEITNCIDVSIAGTYSVTVTDIDGCTSVCSTTVGIRPPTTCTITGDNFFCEGQSTELCTPPSAAAYLWSTGEITNCIDVNAAGTYSVTVTDMDGCTSVCSATVVVIPLPIIICPPNITVDCDDSILAADTGMATSPDNPAPTIDFTDMNMGGVCANTFTITRTWTATNICGGVSSCVQILSVIDTVPPLVECPPNLTVPCADQVPPITTTVVATDNCSSTVSFTHLGDVISDQTCINSFTLTRNYLASDACGNATACVQTINVLDNTPPDVTFVNPLLQDGDTLQVQCYGQDPNWDLPLFDVGSVVADDFCAGAVTVVFNQYELGNGVCENGIIDLFRLSWVATDACDNADSVSIFLALVDTIAPVIYGVPADITVNCNEIPAITDVIFATDECLCACILAVEESSLVDGCLDGQVIVRTWTAKDDCGNMTTATQTITLVDDSSPTFVVVRPEMQGISNGAILNYTCAAGGIPTFFEEPNAVFALDAGTCGESYILSFDVDVIVADDCQALGFVEQRTYTWVATDDCDNIATMTIVARLIDTEAPVFWGVPDTTCLVSPWLDNVAVTDDCDRFNVVIEDFDIPNPCGSGTAILRMYEAFDNCGNTARDSSILIPNDSTALAITFTNPVLAAVGTGETLTLNCDIQNGQYTTFGIDDVEVEGACVGTNLSFSEVRTAAGDCLANGIIATVELRWTATDFCGNSLERVIIANIVDDTAPVFVDFLPEVTIGCNDELPSLYAVDNCGAVTFQTTWDSIIVSNCVFEYEIRRLVTATDACANTTTQLQIIYVGNGDGPVFEGITEVVCDDATLPIVTAFDACSGQFVAVSMQADTLDTDCGGMIIERIWTATDSCGNTSTGHQTVIINDTVPPVIIIPTNTFVASYFEYSYNAVYMSQADQLYELGELEASSVYILDDCDEAIAIEFTVDIVKTENCLESGYIQRRTYTWTATDVCGNATILSFVVHIFDDVPPVFVVTPTDLTVVCAPLPVVAPMSVEDMAQPVTVVFTETIVPDAIPGSFTVTRTWTATDACGNVAVYIQTITWIPDSLVACNITTPNRVECNSHSVLICSDNTGDTAGSTYHWEITGDDCFIQGSPDTECTLIYVGWSPVEIILTVTDRFGCVSTCTETLDCEFAFENAFYTIPLETVQDGRADADAANSPAVNHLQNLYFYPNPAVGSVNLRFESAQEDEVAFSFVNLLGGLAAQGKIIAQEGTNTHQVDVSHLPEGSYLMQVKTKAEIHTKVIVVMRQD